MKVLFVCSGNICRSPMAAEYFRQRAAQSGLSHVIVESAGTLRIEGQPASDDAVRAMDEIGVDLRQHRSTGISEALLRTSDITVAMARDHLDYLARYHPQGEDERLLLRAFEAGSRPGSSPRDLDDPIGKPLGVYRELVPLVVRCVDHLVLHLRHR